MMYEAIDIFSTGSMLRSIQLRTQKIKVAHFFFAMVIAYAWNLVLLSLISCGGHFARSSLSMFGLYMINDGTITPGGLGVLLGACALPSMFVPLIVGHSVDKLQREVVITLVLFLFEICGLTLFCAAVWQTSFALMLVSLLLFGVGTSSISVIQRLLVTLSLKVWLNCARIYEALQISMHRNLAVPIGQHFLHYGLLRRAGQRRQATGENRGCSYCGK
jgi:MFS family permease